MPQRERGSACLRRVVAVLLVCVAAACPVPAPAQESPQALAARALFDEGRRLMAAGQYAEACQKLEESQALRSGLGTQFNLAECHEKTGRTASAWSLYLRVAAETRALGQTEREEVARARATALEPRLSRLVIAVPAAVPGLSVELDGAPMSAATWGIATPLDPGEHQIIARAPGYEDWRGTAQVAGAGAQVEVTVPELRPAAAETAAAAAMGGEPLAASLADSGSDARRHDTTRVYVAGGAGLAGLVVGGLFGLSFLDKNAQAKDICAGRTTACPRTQIEEHAKLKSAARKARSAGFVTAGLGLVGVGLATYWLLDETSGGEPSRSALRLTPELGDSSLGLDLSGEF